MSKITTLKEIIQLFNDFANESEVINDFGWGATWDIGKSRKMDMPYLWVTQRQASRIEVNSKAQTMFYNLTFIFADKINSMNNILNQNGFLSDNTGDIISDLQMVMQDFIIYLQSKSRLHQIMIDGDVSCEIINDQTDDKVAGWMADVTIKVLFKNCATPTNG